MKRLLAGSSFYLLLSTGYTAPNTGVALAQGTVFAPGQKKPVYSRVDSAPLSPPNSTLRKPVLMAGMTPTEFVATAVARINAANTNGELEQFENYFINYHNLLLDYIVKANPTTAAEEDNYVVVTQMMALLKELVNGCTLKAESNGTVESKAELDRKFLNAQQVAKDMMSANLLSPEERHQWFLKEKSNSQQRARLHSTIKSFPPAVMPAEPAVIEKAEEAEETVEDVEARIKYLRELIEKQHFEITEQRLEIGQKRVAHRVTYPQPLATEAAKLSKRDRTTSSAMPEFSPQDLASPDDVEVAGMTPVQFITIIGARIDAADAEESFEKLAEIEYYLIRCYGLVYDQFAKFSPAAAAPAAAAPANAAPAAAAPANAVEEHRYIVTRQIMAMLEDLVSACTFDEDYPLQISWRRQGGQRRLNRSDEGDEQYAKRRWAFARAYGIARGLEYPELLSAEERHQKFLEEKIHADEFARPYPAEFIVIPAVPADLTMDRKALMKKLGEVSGRQRSIIKQQSVVIGRLSSEIAKQNLAIQVASRQKRLRLRVASNAGVVVPEAPAAPQAMPVLPLPNPTIRLDDPSFAEAIQMDGVSPTQFVVKVGEKMFATKSFEELQQYERYLISYYGRLYDYVATSDPTTQVEEDRYVIARQMMNLILKLAASSNFKPPYDSYYWTNYGHAAFVSAQEIAKSIEMFEVNDRVGSNSTTDRHQRFLREKSNWDEHTRPNPLEVVVVKTDLAEPANGQLTQLNSIRVKKLREVIDQQRFTIDQHRFTIAQLVSEIEKHAGGYRQEYSARMAAEGIQTSQAPQVSQTSQESSFGEGSLKEESGGSKRAPHNPFDEPYDAVEVKVEPAYPPDGQLPQIDALREVIKKQRAIIDRQLATIAEQIREVERYQAAEREQFYARQAIAEKKELEPERLLERINELESEIESLKSRRRR